MHTKRLSLRQSKRSDMRLARRNMGFTLIEVMIVVAIVGILASIAVVQFQDHTIRSRVSEVLTAASAVKTTLAEGFLSDGTFPAVGTAIEGDMDSVLENTAYINAGGAVYTVVTSGSPGQVTYQVTLNNLGGNANGDTLLFTFNGNANGVRMNCQGGNLDAKYRPAECR